MLYFPRGPGGDCQRKLRRDKSSPMRSRLLPVKMPRDGGFDWEGGEEVVERQAEGHIVVTAGGGGRSRKRWGYCKWGWIWLENNERIYSKLGLMTLRCFDRKQQKKKKKERTKNDRERGLLPLRPAVCVCSRIRGLPLTCTAASCVSVCRQMFTLLLTKMSHYPMWWASRTERERRVLHRRHW